MINRYIALAVCCMALTIATGMAQAAPQATTSSAAIAPMPLKEALDAFTRRSGLQLVYVSTIIEGLHSPGAPAGLDAQATLQAILQGTGLRFRFLNQETVTIFLPGKDQTPPPAPSTQKETPAADGAEPTVLDRVTVTGSHIRGAPPTSLTIDITQQQMIRAGQTDLGEVIRSIPQNFSGGQNPGIGLGAGDISNQNATGGSALNLRGLGPDATLTLLNGRRLAFGGFAQAVDISQIPVAAVDRIEIVPDGASAIYGSDAVAGVANVILKPDYDGLATSARFGRATGGGEFEQQYNIVGGTRWSSGGFIATANYERTTGLDAAQRSYTSFLRQPYTLLAPRTVRSFVFSAHQELGAHANFKVDAVYNKRSTKAALNEGFALVRDQGDTTGYVVSPTLTFQLPKSWSVSVNATYGHNKTISDSTVFMPDGSLADASRYCNCNRIEGWEVDSQGPVFRLPGGDARLALGGGYHKVSYEGRNLSNPPAHPSPYQQHDYYAFGELYLPVVSPDLHVPGIHQLSFNMAARREQYSTFGGITTPKIGIVYAPTADLDLKASWGKSFKTPTLTQQFQPFIGYLWNAAQIGGVGFPPSATAVEAYGGNSSLGPERAKTWTVTLGLHPGSLPGFHAELGYFHINYDQRVLQGISNEMNALRNPAYAPFVTFDPTLEQIEEVVDRAGTRFYNYAGVPFDPGSVVALINNRYVNFAAWKTHGLDLSARYEVDWGQSRLTLTGNASWLTSQAQSAPTAPVIKLAGTVFNPPRWHARLGATWERGPMVLSAYYSYIGGVTNTMVDPNVEGDSMQFIDLTGIYHFADDFNIRVSIQNIANQRPPYLRTDDPFGVLMNFDSTNYSAMGRFVGITLTKRWR